MCSSKSLCRLIGNSVLQPGHCRRCSVDAARGGGGRGEGTWTVNFIYSIFINVDRSVTLVRRSTRHQRVLKHRMLRSIVASHKVIISDSLTHKLTRSLVHSQTHSLTNSLTHSHSDTHSHTHKLTRSQTHSLNLTHSFLTH